MVSCELLATTFYLRLHPSSVPGLFFTATGAKDDAKVRKEWCLGGVEGPTHSVILKLQTPRNRWLSGVETTLPTGPYDAGAPYYNYVPFSRRSLRSAYAPVEMTMAFGRQTGVPTYIRANPRKFAGQHF